VSSFPFAVAAWVFLVGLYGIVTSRNLIHMIICLSVTQSSTYVLLLAVTQRHRSSTNVQRTQELSTLLFRLSLLRMWLSLLRSPRCSWHLFSRPTSGLERLTPKRFGT
jgi:multisubunit Na+/H+ antiporter MnhC subunit